MLKRIKWKLVFKVFVWLLCLSGTVLLMSFIDVKKHTVKCEKVEIIIPGADNFIEIDEINAILRQNQGDVIGRNLEGINLHEIEKSIAVNPYIDFVKVYAEMDGTVFIEVKQREPVLRIITSDGQDYYIDREGLKIPLSANFTADVLIATGNIFENFNGKVDTLSTKKAKDLFAVANYIHHDEFWNAQIEQIYVNTKNDIELVPRVGNQQIIIGSAKDISIKMNNLLAFYKQVMPVAGWNTYQRINLKYINQVVCEKRDSTGRKNKPVEIKPDSLIAQKAEIDSALTAVIHQELKDETKTDKNKEQKIR